MSAADIINELPKLTEAERRAVREKLSELAAQNEAIKLCHQATLEGAMMLDRMEDEDARRRSIHPHHGYLGSHFAKSDPLSRCAMVCKTMAHSIRVGLSSRLRCTTNKL